MPLRSLQRLVWLHLVMPPKWQVTGRQCWTPGGHHESLPGLAVERKRLGLLWDMPYAQRKTQLCCVDLQILPAWILTLSFSSSQAVAGVRHHLVALEAAAAAIRCTNVRQPDRVRYESRAPRFAIGVYSLPLAPTISAGWGCQECPHSPPPSSSLSGTSLLRPPMLGRPWQSAVGPGPWFALLQSGTVYGCAGASDALSCSFPGISLVLDKPLGKHRSKFTPESSGELLRACVV